MQRLDDAQIVYRTITKVRDIQQGRVLSYAFLRRSSPRDEDGLSVDYNVEFPDGCGALLEPKSRRGIAELKVGSVREIPAVCNIPGTLDVLPDDPTHANITGIPREEESVELSESVAAELAVRAKLVWTQQ